MDDIFEAINPLERHQKEEAKRFWDENFNKKDATKAMIHAFDQFLSVDQRFYEIVRFNKSRYSQTGTVTYPEAEKLLDEIEKVYSQDRQKYHSLPPYRTIDLLTATLRNEETKCAQLYGDDFSTCDDFCITLSQLLQYLRDRIRCFH